ncbi:Dph6-related ATP pyrophosphatase [Vibrio gallicus]|uniref:Dph6-related ATP pyrophosphatase n=1 Tax=Vibrio gallicus TaxID=190897 RepID=UPI0021C383CE|nr:diphthine--ammonia ligase [Vibrio gallicus]
MIKAIFTWSGGKDSSLALHKIQQRPDVEVVALLTTLNKEYRRISMHGVREELLENQAESLGLPLIKMWVEQDSYDEYEQRMKDVLLEYQSQGVTHVVYGDIFLEDLREYRDNNLAKIGLKGIYPLWKRDTSEVIQEFLALGFKTVTCCINDQYLDESHVGATITQDWINALPPEVDPCGENGEFHTFCFDGPNFSQPVVFDSGDNVYKPLDEKYVDETKNPHVKGFWFSELIPR